MSIMNVASVFWFKNVDNVGVHRNSPLNKNLRNTFNLLFAIPYINNYTFCNNSIFCVINLILTLLAAFGWTDKLVATLSSATSLQMNAW